MDMHTEFFPGMSDEPGMTYCRGWADGGVALILPYSLVSVEQEQDRYAEFSQLWRDADGDYWMISYRDDNHEWFASFLGEDLEAASKILAAAREDEILRSTPMAYRILAASEGVPLKEIWEKVNRESDYIKRKRHVYGSAGDEETFWDVLFKDGSWLRVLDPYAIKYNETKLIEAFPS